MGTTASDPKTIVTPDAFSVHPPLLGTPLAPPWRRGIALLIDIVLVASITALTSGFWFVLGVVGAAFLFTRAKKSGEDDRAPRGFRLLLGCMGFAVLGFTAVVVIGLSFIDESHDESGLTALVEGIPGVTPGRGSSSGSVESSGGDGLRTALGVLQEGAQLRSSDDPDEAVALAVVFGRQLLDISPEQDIEELLRSLIPDNVGGVGGDAILLRAMSQLDAQVLDETRRMEMAGALDLVGDTIGELEENLSRVTRDLEDTRADLAEARERRGLVGWFTSRLDSLGFGFGWWTLYFAILMPWMKGQTPGKRALGVRVVRLDGHPVTWWHAFERAGGYAAGLATGTLGFAQIFWDANRQGIHDKVAGTVVVLDGLAKVPGHWDPKVAGMNTRLDDKDSA